MLVWGRCKSCFPCFVIICLYYLGALFIWDWDWLLVKVLKMNSYLFCEGRFIQPASLHLSPRLFLQFHQENKIFSPIMCMFTAWLEPSAKIHNDILFLMKGIQNALWKAKLPITRLACMLHRFLFSQFCTSLWPFAISIILWFFFCCSFHACDDDEDAHFWIDLRIMPDYTKRWHCFVFVTRLSRRPWKHFH